MPPVAIARLSEILVEDRLRQDLGDIESLALSIKETDLMQPLVVLNLDPGKTKAEPPYYKLICGGRRFAACTLAGLEVIPVRVYDEPLGELELLKMELVENLERKDLTWPEQVKGLQRLDEIQKQLHIEVGQPLSNYSSAELSENLGISTPMIYRDIRIANAIKDDPELEKCQTKTDVIKEMSRKKEAGLHAEVRRRAEALNPELGTEVSRGKQSILQAYVLKDSLDGLKALETESFDFIDLDPPWGVGLDSVASTFSTVAKTTATYVDKKHTPESYIEFLTPLMKECFRVLRNDRWLICWFSTRYFIQETKQVLESCGFKLNDMPALWTKLGSRASGQDPLVRLASRYETFFYAAKGSPVLIKNPGNVFQASPPDDRMHQSEKPLSLMTEILGTFCLPLYHVLIPFLGSGNTLLAANLCMMNGIGFEREVEFKNAFATRLEGFTLRMREMK